MSDASRDTPAPPNTPEALRPGDLDEAELADAAGEEGHEGDAADGHDAGSTWDPHGLDLARAVAASVGSARSGAASGVGNAGQPRWRTRRARQSSGAGPDDRDPQTLDATMDRLVAERGWSTDVAVAGALARWEQIVGPDLAAHCRAERYVDAELTVRADSTAWATQVRLLAPTLVKRLNEELGDGTVRRVVVVGPSVPSFKRGSRAARDGRGPRDTYG